MKAHVFGVMSAFALAGCATTPVQQPRDATQASTETRIAIEGASAQWAAASLAKDVATLERLMAPEFILTRGAGANPIPRSQWLANLARMDIDNYRTSVTDVRQYGQIAVAQTEGEWTMSMDGRVTSKPFLLADFWVYRDGRWQVFRRHTIR